MSEVSTQTQELFGTLDEFLVSIADGIVAAQTELGKMSVGGAPGQQYTYYIPKLDFELRIDLKVETTSTGTEKVLKMKPVAMADALRTQAEIVSVVRGSFVAVPANDGLPALVLDASVTRVGGVPHVEARVRNAAGELVVGLEVEFNLDRDATRALGGVAPAAGTDVALAVVRTGADGIARTAIVRAGEDAAPVLVFTVDAGPRTTSVSWEVAS